VSVRVMIGEAFGLRSPVPTLSPTLYVDLQLAAGAALQLPAAARERAVYGVDEGFELDGQPVPAATMVVLPEAATPRLTAPQGARVVMVGGEPLGHRFMWWNFVSSRKERIAQAADDWAAQRFPRVPGETEFIPLPSSRL
jgi:redox-sensitive bicupin YhaK (pirin superfamily)